ncbi:MAG: hypothetical protein ICV73_00405 [Acetobacteraceae bacterium]|nr:hypothetical protein [Acetobacteraceae bacterium]
MNLNVLLRGQSNAEAFGTVSGGALLAALARDVERLLGFDGATDTVSVLFAADTADGANTVVGGTGFLTEWVGQRAADWRDGWYAKSLEQGLLDFVGRLPAEQRDDPTAVLWFHSEFDSQRGGLTAAEWESAVRYDAALLRATFGQQADTVPYLFVSAHPYSVWWGRDSDTGHQAIRQGMENLAADRAFNADIAARLLDTDINGDDPTDYGDQHLSPSDLALAEGRIMRSLAETWAAYAKPGSPVALASGQIDDHGPRAVAATATAPNQLLVRFALDGATNLEALDADAARGLGWSVRSATGEEVEGSAAALAGTDALLLTLDGPVPAGGKLFYGWGYGRLAGSNAPGQGNAVYDEQGMPVWVDAAGLAIAGVAASASVDPLL